MIANSQFLGRIVVSGFLLGLLLPLLFASLGSSDSLAHFSEGARKLVNALAIFWPALGQQYEFIRQTLGDGHAASFAIFSAVLLGLPIVVAIVACVEYQRRRAEILGPGRDDLKILAICLACIPLQLFFSGVGQANRLYRFHADSWGFFYFVQYALFFTMGYAVTYLAYLAGRFVIDRHHQQNRKQH